MEITEYLMEGMKRKKCQTVKEYFNSLGGKEVLKIDLRQFQEVLRGKKPPSEKFFASIFKMASPRDYKDLVISYFQSNENLKEISELSEVVGYLKNFLHHPVREAENLNWDNNDRVVMYNEEQLNYLSENIEALILHKKILLEESLKIKDLEFKQEILNRLVDLQLVELDRELVRPYRSLYYRMPTYPGSSPRAVSAGNRYLLSQIRAFLSLEGSENQDVHSRMQMVTYEHAEIIRKEIKNLRDYISSIISSEVDEEKVVPIMFTAFFKKISKVEFI